MSASATEDDSSVAQTSEQHVGHGIVWECSRDIECPRGGHAHHQADEAFGSEDRPGRYSYGGDSGPGAVDTFGSGRISGQ